MPQLCGVRFEGARLQACRQWPKSHPALAAEGNLPQGLKANIIVLLAARLKPCPFKTPTCLYPLYSRTEAAACSEPRRSIWP